MLLSPGTTQGLQRSRDGSGFSCIRTRFGEEDRVQRITKEEVCMKGQVAVFAGPMKEMEIREYPLPDVESDDTSH